MTYVDRNQSRRRKQLTLLNVLLLVTTAAALAGIVSSYFRLREERAIHRAALLGAKTEANARIVELEQEVDTVKAQNRALRAEGGVLTVDDGSKIHAIALRTRRNQQWSYRVYLPNDGDYFFACQVNQLPVGQIKVPEIKPPGKKTVAGRDHGSAIWASGGEYVVTASVFRQDDRYQYRFDVEPSRVSPSNLPTGGASSASAAIDEGYPSRWPYVMRSFSRAGVASTMTIASSDQPLILLNGRSFGDQKTSSRDSEEGIMIWVQRITR